VQQAPDRVAKGPRPAGGSLLAAARFAVCMVSRSRGCRYGSGARRNPILVHAPVNLYPSRFPGNPRVVVITNYTTLSRVDLQRFLIKLKC
jgi:hypothetical protein